MALAKHRAKKNGTVFNLSYTDIDYPEFCPVLGLRLKPGHRVPHDCSPTIDRIEGHLGYVPGNVLVISLRANRLKGDAGFNELKKVAAFFEQLGRPE